MTIHAHADLAYVLGAPSARGEIRSHPEDFVVDEELGFAPHGEGEHVLLQLRKRNANTEWVARTLARHAGVRPVDVGFAGLKDRAAVTTQWFSVHLPGRPPPDWHALEHEDLQFLSIARHNRKLRRGSLRGNRFGIIVRQIEGEHDALDARLQRLAREGVPNYFGEQRFGHGGRNLDEADALFRGVRRRLDRHKRGLYLSAARSFLFNCVLSRRVGEGNWNQPVAGDVMMLEGSHSVFAIDQVTDEILQRLAMLDIHPSGPLWGRGRPLSHADCQHLEQETLAEFESWRNGLEHAGLKQERRALRLKLESLNWDWLEEGALRLRFVLPRGAYATSVLRELLQYRV